MDGWIEREREETEKDKREGGREGGRQGARERERERERLRASTTFRSISGFPLPSVRHKNTPL